MILNKNQEQKLSDLNKLPPLSAEEFIEQCKEGCRRQRELLKILMEPRSTPNYSPGDKLETARTCVAAQLDYYSKDPDYPPDDFVAMYQLNQLLLYSDSWEQLLERLCFDEPL